MIQQTPNESATFHLGFLVGFISALRATKLREPEILTDIGALVTLKLKEKFPELTEDDWNKIMINNNADIVLPLVKEVFMEALE